MPEPTLNAVPCPAACAPDQVARVTPNKKDGYTIHCPACGFQGFAKTPRAANAIRARITPAKPVEKEKTDDGFSLEKL